MKKIITVCFAMIAMLGVMLGAFNVITPTHVFASVSLSYDNSTVKEQNLKVLTIRIDPWLESKNQYASRFIKDQFNIFSSVNLYRDYSTVVNEYKDSIYQMSHGNVTATIVKEEHLNEFPTYNDTVKRLDNSTDNYSLDEASWLDFMSEGVYYWAQTETGEYMADKDFTYGKFDYDYLVEKFNLVERKNRGEFDIVWLCELGDTFAYESMIVGKSSYWDNGQNIVAPCENFLITTVMLARSETYLECMGHSAEQTLQRVFMKNAVVYDPTVYNGVSFGSLNTWMKFRTYDSLYPNHSVSGNVHYAPNSTTDYQWDSTTKVQSLWKDWRDNYPNLTGHTTPTDCSAWNTISSYDQWVYENDKGVSNFNLGHKIWWFKNMPHVAGRDADGFSNNWWDYIYGLDWATSVENTQTTFTAEKGKQINFVRYNITYNSGKTALYTLNALSANTTILSGENLIDISSKGVITARENGTVTLETYFDGIAVVSTINIQNEVLPTEYTISFDANGGRNNIESYTVVEGGTFTTPTKYAIRKPNFILTSWRVGESGLYLESDKEYNIDEVIALSGSGTTIVLIPQWQEFEGVDLTVDPQWIILAAKAFGIGAVMLGFVLIICHIARKPNE